MTSEALKNYEMAISALHNGNGDLAPRETVAAAIEALRALVTDASHGDVDRRDREAAIKYAIDHNVDPLALIDRAEKAERELASLRLHTDGDADPRSITDYEIEQLAEGVFVEEDFKNRLLQHALFRTIAIRCAELIRDSRNTRSRATSPDYVWVTDQTRFARICLDLVKSPGTTPVGDPGSVMREAWELGRRLENLSDEVDRLSALVKQMSESRDEVLRKMQKNYDIVVSQANAHNEARIDAIKERGIAVDRANAAESVVAELKVALERAIQQRDTRTATTAISDAEIVSILSRVAAINPDALQLFTQLLGVPACPKCDRVMRPGHVCK